MCPLRAALRSIVEQMALDVIAGRFWALFAGEMQTIFALTPHVTERKPKRSHRFLAKPPIFEPFVSLTWKRPPR